MNLKEVEENEEAKTGGLGSQNASEKTGRCPDPSQKEKSFPESQTGRISQFSTTSEEVRQMWEQWERDQEQRRQAEIQADVIEGTWTGGWGRPTRCKRVALPLS